MSPDPIPKPPSETPEPIFENVVAEKYPDAYAASQVPEEVPAEVSSVNEVDHPTAQVLDSVPSVEHEDSKMKYIFIGIIAVIFLGVFFGLIALFNRKSASVAVPVTLTYWGLWEDEAIYRSVFDAYKLANPHVTISYEKKSPKDYLSFLKGRSTNKKGPDIFRFHNTWLPQLVSTTEKYLAPLPTSIMTSTEYESTFYKINQQDLMSAADSKYYGIPLYIDNLVLIYNPDILKAGGIAAPPRQWVGGELQAAVNAVTVKGIDDVPVTSGIALGTANNVEHFSDIFAVLMMLNPPPKQSDLNNAWALNRLVTLGTPDNTALAGEALNVYRYFDEEHIWSSKLPNSIDAFAQGKVAMIFAYSWQIPIIKSKNPDIKIAVAALPEGIQGEKVTIASYWVEGVSPYAPAPNQLEAWKLLKYMASPVSLQKIFEAQTKTRGLGTVYSRVDMKSKLSDNKLLAPIIEQADYSVSLPLNTRTFDKGLDDEIVSYIGKAIDGSGTGVAYSAAIAEAAKGIDSTLTKYKIK
ncbi:MAG: extracellular solute-binding protein [bacterium]